MSNSVIPPIDQCIIDELRSVLENEVSNQFNKEKVCKNLLKMLKNLSGKTSLSV